LDALTYTATLPAKRMAAGALFFDECGRILLVEPTYKDVWEIPGGVVEADESPRAACLREIHEELGIECRRLRLLAIDWVSPRIENPEGIKIIFDGGQLSQSEISRIRTPDDELLGYSFRTLSEAQALVAPEMARRLAASMAAIRCGATIYLEDGYPIGK
jgi:8-oxo-dGTP diphosphatase